MICVKRKRFNNFDDVKPDVVIHLAAVVGGIGANRDNPGRFFYENMVMGLRLIEQARVFNLSNVMIGTVCLSKVYAGSF